ncbi:hypothetical protein CVT25_012323 [Psilocybe cyanescens]|uniref:Uncharacterized protein n=1 Tax=Psilocybe cyanescens TaxID=93625 RepID=A0A409VR07_PSICY|nr:hypothetical protein CVT25_012323 [Psilocybe cyanescens]
MATLQCKIRLTFFPVGAAFPFVLPPDEAVRRMSPYAKYSCGEFGLLDRILPEVFVEPKRPVNLEAVYMPAWLIGGSSLFNFVFDKGTLKETRGMFANYANTMYIPGCDIPLLSTANVWSSRVMKDNVPIPFSDSFLKGQIEDIENEYIKGITCFPFTISPFSVLKLIQTASGLTVKLGNIEAYIERARIHSFSAMPVLLPMYAAKHQDKDGKSFMMFIEAHTASVKFDKLQTFSVKVKHGIKLPPRQTLRNSSEELVIDLEKYDNGVEVFDTGYAFGRVNGLYENINSKTDHAFAEVYLWNLLGIYKNIQQLASMGSLSSDEDPRIREMTADEIASRTETIDKWQQKLEILNYFTIRCRLQKKETQRSILFLERSRSYFSKIFAAYPFEVSPEEALRQIGGWAGTFSSTTPSGLISSVLATTIPFLEYQRPIKMSAVYFPAWILNAELEAKLTHGSLEHDASATIRNTYIPAVGFDAPLLSAAPLWRADGDNFREDLVSFTEDLLEQHGEEVQCIPFSVSPFTLLDIPASLDSKASWDITRDLSVSPSSIKTTMFSAQPVLIPLYVGLYKVNETGQAMTFFTSGHSNQSNVMTQNIRGQNRAVEETFKGLSQLSLFKWVDLDSEVFKFVDYEPARRVHIGGVSITPAVDTAKAISKWLEDQLDSSQNISKLASLGNFVSDDDPRVREMSEEEDMVLKKYLDLSSEISMVKRIIETMKSANAKAMVLTYGGGKMPQFQAADGAAATLQSKLEDLERQRQEAKPQWWVEWELSNGKLQ